MKSSLLFDCIEGHAKGILCLHLSLLLLWNLKPLLYSPQIHPTTHLGTQHKISAYADDIILFISDPKASISPLLQLINTFGSFSGYKINWGKSKLVPLSNLGNMIFLKTTPFRIVSDKFTSLGIILKRRLSQLL